MSKNQHSRLPANNRKNRKANPVKTALAAIKKNSKPILACLFIILLLYGGLIRLYGLGNDSFWIDEAISSLAAKKIHQDFLPVFESGKLYSRAFVFHYILSGFLLFGYNEFNARLISVFFGLATCVLIFFIAKEYSKNAAWAAFVLSLFLEIFIVYSRQARMYQMEMFLFFLSLFLLYKSIKPDERQRSSADEETGSGKRKGLKKNAISESAIQQLIRSIRLLSTRQNILLASAFCVFLFAYETHPVAVVLLPLFLYAVIIRRMRPLFYILLALAGMFIAYDLFVSVSQLRTFYLSWYIAYIRYYLPFILISLLGVILSWKHRMTLLLLSSALIMVVALGFTEMFGYRYSYMLFLPMVVFAAVAFSMIRLRWVVLTAYIVLVSNIFVPMSYVAILVPEAHISHFDITAPAANFRQAYDAVKAEYHGESLIVSFTPAAEWYFKKPDYWLYFSFSGRNETWMRTAGEDREVYTGAYILGRYDDFLKVADGSIVVLDSWGASRIDREVAQYAKNNCTRIYADSSVLAARC